ncbi:MAG: HEAT repeat domain-containing protein [Acidobacteriia bacterium]|nr:HEAT repeat domain-containing protein [Terriglobia bacterium]
MRPRVFSAGFPLLALALAAIAIAAGAPEPAAPPAPAEDPSILKLAAVLRAEDRRIADDPLRAALSDPSPRVRAAAVRAVGRIGGPGASTLLVAALKDVEASVRVEAAFGLGQLADATALPRLLEAAKDADALARSAVAEALGKIHAPSSADVLATLLLDPDVKVRASACLAAWKFADPSFAVEPLIKASADPDPFSAFAAAYALARLGAEGLEPPSSGAAPGKLGEADRSRVRARLVGLAKSRVAEVRMQAARGLFAPALLQETRALGTLTSDNEIGVRVNAIRSLSFPGAPIDPYVRGALGSRDKAVAYAAAEGLGRISGPMAKDLLVSGIVNEPCLWIKVAMVATLGKMSPDVAAAIAAGVSKDPSPELRAAAALNLAGRTDPKSREIVDRLLGDPDPRVQAAAVASRAGADGSLAELLKTTPSSPDPAVREAVARVAGLRLERPRATSEEREEALALIEAVSKRAAADTIPLAKLAALDAASRGGKNPRAHALLEAGLADPDRLVRLKAIDELRSVFGEDQGSRAGAASERPIQDYVEILKWGSKPRAVIVTMHRPGYSPARFTIALDTETAPLASWNFARLADRGFFDGLTIHRAVPNFVIQDGDPRGDGNGDPGYSIRDELGRARFLAGTVGMATDGPDTAGSQWFVALSAQPHLDGRYTAFGSVVQNFLGVVLRTLPGDHVATIRSFEGTGTEPLR